MSSASDSDADRRRLAALRPALDARSRTLQAVRGFFTDRGFVEIDTPVRIPAPALELHIDAIPSADQYLRTSPELHMKRLLAAGYERIFQLGPCFRAGERGRLHNPEYTMLEWYRSPGDYLSVLDDAEGLVPGVARELLGDSRVRFGGRSIDLARPWPRMAVRDAFVQHAGWDPVAAFDADRFDFDLVGKVEPCLPLDRPVVLMDYPIEAGALARPKPGQPTVAERWELYIGGVEIANAFSELTDASEQRRRFEQCAAERRAMGRAVYPMDEAFLAALERSMPASGGVALGIDRLVMILAGCESLDDVIAFRDG